MTNYCLDTSILIEMLHGNEHVRKRIAFLANIHHQIFATHIALCELFRGVFLSKKQEDELALATALIDSMNGVLGLDTHSCMQYGLLYANQKKAGTVQGDLDLMIAAVVMTNDATLLTMDKSFSHIDGLNVEVW